MNMNRANFIIAKAVINNCLSYERMYEKTEEDIMKAEAVDDWEAIEQCEELLEHLRIQKKVLWDIIEGAELTDEEVANLVNY